MFALPADHILAVRLPPDLKAPGAFGVPGELEAFFMVHADAFCGVGIIVIDAGAGLVAPDEGPGFGL